MEKVKPLRKQVPERVARRFDRRFAVLFDEPSVPKRNYIVTMGRCAAPSGPEGDVAAAP